MINFTESILKNGLKIVIHSDPQTPLAVVNILYNVGAKHEEEHKTGFAHLFEHLMFGGSKNIPDFDKALQKAGADNNAFTNNDFTNYHITLSAENIETALWAESDRMLALTLNQHVLDVQKKVVIEEYKQRYLNQPYGDTWHKLRSMAYKVHPYRWPTIGKDISHIKDAQLEDVKTFFERYYNPDNAVITVCGNVHPDDTIRKIEKWFGNIPKGNFIKPDIPSEPKQTEARLIETRADVPQDALYKVYHMPARNEQGYYTTDLLSDILGRGKSSRLYQSMIQRKKLFSNISASINGSFDKGLLIIAGRINPGVQIEEANKAVEEEIDWLLDHVDQSELDKVKNQAESSILFSEAELMNRALGLSVGCVMGNTNLVNEEINLLRNVSLDDLSGTAKNVLDKNNCCTMYYKKQD